MNILVISPYTRDASSFWRCMGPMSYLARHSNSKINIEVPSIGTQLAWDTIIRYDLVFMHRPCRRDDLTVMQIAKNANVPVWIDYDDWLFELPNWNPHQGSYHNPNLQILMAQMIACANVITVTTGALYQAFSKLNENVVICPNAYPSDMLPWRSKEPPERRHAFAWRGTNTHDGDLWSVKEGLKSLPDCLQVLGELPYSIRSEMDISQYNIIPHLDVTMYWQRIYELAPKFLIFPLADCFFNRCKSNIAWIEGCHAGSMTIAPDLPEWKQPGIINYKADNLESFNEAIHTATHLTPEIFHEQTQLSFEYMMQKYDISVINDIRVNICDAMFSRKFKWNKFSPFDQATGIWALSQLKNGK